VDKHTRQERGSGYVRGRDVEKPAREGSKVGKGAREAGMKGRAVRFTNCCVLKRG
jgi:hypothetical protein